MDNLDKTIKLNSLYDIYKALLTEKQRLYFEAYYFKDQSLSEIAEKFEVSRNAVYSQLNDIENILDDFEAKLHLRRKAEKLRALVKDLRNASQEEKEVIYKKLEEL